MSKSTKTKTSKKGGAKTGKNAKKEPAPPPPPPTQPPLYSFPLTREALALEEEKLLEEARSYQPVLPSVQSKLEQEQKQLLVDPSVVYQEEEYHFRSRASDYLAKNLWGYEPQNSTLEISNGATDFVPNVDDELKKEVLHVYKQAKAVTLLTDSEGNSVLARGKTTSDASSRIIEDPLALETSTNPDENTDVLDRYMHEYLSDARIREAGKSFIEPSDDDPTRRIYSIAPTGRSISSIYHPDTKRPSKISSLISKSKITNDSLLTYLSTENIQDLDLENCSGLNNKILSSIGQYCPSLVSLNLQNCTQVIDSTIRIICNGCPELKFVNLGMCYLITDDGIKEIFQHCVKIRVLSVHSCEKITGDAFFYIKSCDQMEVLDLSYCSNLSDMALQYISEYCPKLLHLDITGCELVGDEGLSAIYKHCSSLQTLRMILCDQPLITASCLSEITKFARSLQVLELTGVTQLTDAAAQNIVKYAQNMEFLSFSGCNNVSDMTLKVISQACQNLRCIELCSCKKVSVQALLELIHNIKTLSRMIISECNISESEIVILRKYSSRCLVLKHIPKQPEKQGYYVMYTKTPARKKGKSRARAKK